ncbi:MAG: hypothetical protein H7840_06480 [Alphaproteobacteria bacterium]
MLSIHDCIAFSGLTGDQLDAVAFHQQLPPIIAAEWAETILDLPGGGIVMTATLASAVRWARAVGHHRDVARFEDGLRAFLAN